MKIQQSSTFSLTVEFEDVDANGVVHHSNYFKYLERSRTYCIKLCDYSVEKILSSGLALVISEIHANYLRPAQLGQKLYVINRVKSVGKSSIKICQIITLCLPTNEEQATEEKIYSWQKTIFWAEITLVCVDLKSIRPTSIPQGLKQAIKMLN